MNQVLELKSKFERTVRAPVQVIEDLWLNKLPQKCMVHSNNFTLYCEQDRKPLCASCMYQNNAHRAHRVNALNLAGDSLVKDAHRFELELQKTIDNLTGLVQHVNRGISRLDEEFPHVLVKIEEYYQNLH